MMVPGTLDASRRPAWPLASSLPPLAPFDSVPSIARAHLGVMVTSWQLGKLADTGALVASELTTNAVNASMGPDGNPRYIGGRMPVVRLNLFSDGITLLVEVCDQAPGRPLLLNADAAAERGRGLTLVHALTRGQWSWHGTPGGKVVWAALSAG
jgi:serine/threonine-protein kinase RsbW